MTDREAMMATVRAYPDDDRPRLVMADRLEENAGVETCLLCRGRNGPIETADAAGNPVVGDCPWCLGRGVWPDADGHLAEFIRVGCELASPVAVTDVGGVPRWRSVPAVETKAMRDREFRLFARRRIGWYGKDEVFFHLREPVGRRSDEPAVVVRRGFPEAVVCPLDWWVGGECPTCRGHGFVAHHSEGECPDCGGPGRIGTGRMPGRGPELVREWPIKTVTVTDREPADLLTVNARWYWFRGEDRGIGSGLPDRLPDGIFSKLDGAKPDIVGMPYRTRDEAMASLSRACVAWAKGARDAGRVVHPPPDNPEGPFHT